MRLLNDIFSSLSEEDEVLLAVSWKDMALNEQSRRNRQGKARACAMCRRHCLSVELALEVSRGLLRYTP